MSDLQCRFFPGAISYKYRIVDIFHNPIFMRFVNLFLSYEDLLRSAAYIYANYLLPYMMHIIWCRLLDKYAVPHHLTTSLEITGRWSDGPQRHRTMKITSSLLLQCSWKEYCIRWKNSKCIAGYGSIIKIFSANVGNILYNYSKVRPSRNKLSWSYFIPMLSFSPAAICVCMIWYIYF